jgi:predicted AlkP superfamily pyrophosphatase or phosphodiesterase
MVSIDGLRADALDDPSLALPALRGLAARGARAHLRPVFPTVTWPCHASLVTGVGPARHGVLGNHVFDRARGETVSHYGDRAAEPLAVETLWDRVHARGDRAVALCWPSARGAVGLAEAIPECYEQALFEAHASRPLWAELRSAGLPVDRYAAWSTCRAQTPMQDWLTLEAARHVLATRPPRLLLVHFLTLDSVQHEHGVVSPEARWALQHVDALLGRLLDALDAGGGLESAAVVVFGDHGFVDVETTHQVNQLLHQEGLLDLDRTGAVARRRAWVECNGGSAYVYALDGTTTAARLRERFAALPGVHVLGPDEFPSLGLPAPGAHPAQGDLVLVADEGVMFAGHPTPEAAARAPGYRATHGHAPVLPQLASALVMAGAGVPSAVPLGAVSMLDVAPTCARLLGLELPAAEGKALQVAFD